MGCKPWKEENGLDSLGKLTKAKRDCGLGFRDIQCFHDAMLAKLSWRILEEPNYLISRVLKGKYCNYADFMDCSVPNTASHGWRGILAGRDLLAKYLGWAIGNGLSVKVWQDHCYQHMRRKSLWDMLKKSFHHLKWKTFFFPIQQIGTKGWSKNYYLTMNKLSWALNRVRVEEKTSASGLSTNLENTPPKLVNSLLGKKNVKRKTFYNQVPFNGT